MTSDQRQDNDVDRPFDQLSDKESAVVGSRDDYDWDSSISTPARERPDMTQFSIRIERKVYEGLQAAADRRGLKFSDVARAALRAFVAGDQTMVMTNVFVTVGSPPTKRFQLPGERTTNFEPPSTSGTGSRLATTVIAR